MAKSARKKNPKSTPKSTGKKKVKRSLKKRNLIVPDNLKFTRDGFCDPISGTNIPIPKMRIPYEHPDYGKLYCTLIDPLPENRGIVPSTEQQTMYATWVKNTRIYMNTLSKQDLNAIEYYLSGGYHSMREVLQGIAKDNFVDKMNKKLQNIILRAPRPPGNFTIWRGTSSDWWQGGRPPRSFTPNQFSSFSTSLINSKNFFPEKGIPFLIEVNIDPHSTVLLVSPFNDREHEIIFPLGTTFSLVNQFKISQIQCFTMTVA